MIPRFEPEARKANQPIVELVARIAERKRATPARIALAWVLAQNPWIVPIPGTTKPPRLHENIAAADLELTADDLAEINEAAAQITIEGARLLRRTPTHHRPLNRNATRRPTRGSPGVTHGDSHVQPAVASGQHVNQGALGHVASIAGHVHLAERTPGGPYLNPLHPGALAPLAKTQAPTIDRILAERNRHPLNPNALTEIVDLIAEHTT